MTVAAYLRVSTEDQHERGTIETQRQEIQRYLERNGIHEFEYYEDAGVSGTMPFDCRREGARVLTDARLGKIDTVLVYRVDRIGRETLVILNAIAALKAIGIKLVSATEHVDLNSPAGVMQLTMLSGAATFERDTFLQRSLDGTNRLAREGAWLGGVTPYGYYVAGKAREARLVPSEETIPGYHMSEAEVIRLIFRLAAQEGWSCIAIAEHLNDLRVPTSYAKDGRKVKFADSKERGKRKVGTAEIWRAGGIRRLLITETYKGLHIYGKRSKKANRELIHRDVPALVSGDEWNLAQEVLRKNYRFGRRDSQRQYLLKGLIKCVGCGLTFIATGDDRSGKVYYRCSGKMNRRVLTGSHKGHKCESASVGIEVEDAVWNDVETFLRNPGDVLTQLEGQRRLRLGNVDRIRGQVEVLNQNIERKDEERKRAIGLLVKGLISEDELRIQRGVILAEEDALKGERKRLLEQIRTTETAQAESLAAEELLIELNRKLDNAVCGDTRRRLIEVLVESIRVETVERQGSKEAHVNIRYRFHIGNEHTDARAATTAIPSAPAPAAIIRSPATWPASPAPSSTASTSTSKCLD